MAKQLAKREGSEVEEAPKPSKRPSKDSCVGFTKAVILCNSSELSKSENKTYRPNNIVVELLKKNPMRYGKVSFLKFASEEEIREELRLRFPILNYKTLSFASADQYGKLNFRESEKWTGRNVRRWLPGSSAMYLIFEGDDTTDERCTKSEQTIPCSNMSSGLSFTTMRTSPASNTVLSWNSSRSQRALIDFLSSPEKVKINETQRRKIFAMNCGGSSNARALPRSWSSPEFSASSSHTVVKKEKVDIDLEFSICCEHCDDANHNECNSKMNNSSTSSSAVSLEKSPYARRLGNPAELVKERLHDNAHTQHSDNNQIHSVMRSRDSKSKRKFAVTFDSEKSRTIYSPNHDDSPAMTINKHREEIAHLLNERIRASKANTNSGEFDARDGNQTSVRFSRSQSLDAKIDTRQHSQSPDQDRTDDTRDWASGKKRNQTISSEETREFVENIDKDNENIRRCLVPCYMIPNPLYAGHFYRSVTSHPPAFCVPTNNVFPWKQEQYLSSYGSMMYKGNIIAPLPFAPPYKQVFPYRFNDGNVQSSPMDTGEPSSEQQDTHEDFHYEIIPSKGTCKGGDTFVILFKEPLDEQLLVSFGETAASDVTLDNPYTIKGVTPESSGPGPVAVTIATKDGQNIGRAIFTYVDEFNDKLAKTVLFNKNREFLVKMVTPSKAEKSQESPSEMKETGEKALEEKIVESKPGKQIKLRLSTSQDHVISDTIDNGEAICCSDRTNVSQDHSVKTSGQAKSVYEGRIPFIPNNPLDEQTTIDLIPDKQEKLKSESSSPAGIKEADNLLLLSSIASKMKDDTSIHSKASSQTKRTNGSKHTKKADSKSDSPPKCGFHKKVFILPPNSLYLPSQSDLCKLRMSGNCYSKIFFHATMSEDDVIGQIRKTFPDLKDLRLQLSVVDQTGKLVFHEQIWTGKSIRKKLRGNSVLYVSPIY